MTLYIHFVINSCSTYEKLINIFILALRTKNSLHSLALTLEDDQTQAIIPESVDKNTKKRWEICQKRVPPTRAIRHARINLPSVRTTEVMYREVGGKRVWPFIK